ncbi:murein biosynthesis integral membrane protein MurJ, partial [Frankia sp. R82]|uniref:murein biosynthesis integral membrane protein MurJ n=1 Tax=Frankia sp. R82 TaxID=2950553 RepID=UPI0027E23E94
GDADAASTALLGRTGAAPAAPTTATVRDRRRRPNDPDARSPRTSATQVASRTSGSPSRSGKATKTGKTGKTGKAGPSLGQASGIMAIGTIASRASGFLRTVAIATAIGTGAVGDAYNVANTTPNILYDLLLGGILTSVVVPVMVRAAKEDPDGGDSFASSLLTLMILGLGVATAIGMVAAPWITDAYLDANPAEQALATDLLRWFLPQIVFYGVGATIGAILNVRRSFAAPMFAPILNNVLVIATCVAFIYLVSGPRPPGVSGPKQITDTQITVLAGGTTLGVVAMTLALLPALRKVGFRYRPRLDLRHPELRSAARLAGWTLLFVVVSQAGYLVIVNLSTASTAYTIYTYGYQIFQLPYAIIGVSVITALLPRMSGHAAQDRRDLVRADISTATRVAATAIVPAALFLLALGRPIAVAVFHHGAVDYHDAIAIGDTLSAFALALVPFSLFQVQLRAFYAYQDSRTPALVNMGVVAVNVLGALVLTVLVPEKHRAPALALAFAAAYLVGLAAATTLLRRRLGGVDGNRTARVITQVAIAAGLGAVLASLVARGIRGVLGTGWLTSGLAVVVASGLGGALFLAAAVRMNVHEVNALLAAVRSRLRRGRPAGGQPRRQAGAGPR